MPLTARRIMGDLPATSLRAGEMYSRQTAPGAHRRARPRADEPGQGVLPAARADEGRPRALLRRPRRSGAESRRAPADADEALSERRRRRLLLSEARAGAAPGLAGDREDPVPERARRGLSGHDGAGVVRKDREPRLH